LIYFIKDDFIFYETVLLVGDLSKSTAFSFYLSTYDFLLDWSRMAYFYSGWNTITFFIRVEK